MTGLYPNEVASDFAYIPFGAGARKCIGDQFAMLEATVCMAMVLRRYNFELLKPAKDIGMEMGATIHTAGGLPMRITMRQANTHASPAATATATAAASGCPHAG